MAIENKHSCVHNEIICADLFHKVLCFEPLEWMCIIFLTGLLTDYYFRVCKYCWPQGIQRLHYHPVSTMLSNDYLKPEWAPNDNKLLYLVTYGDFFFFFVQQCRWNAQACPLLVEPEQPNELRKLPQLTVTQLREPGKRQPWVAMP